MKYILLIATDPATWPTDQSDREQMTKEYAAFTQQIAESGELVAGDQLSGTETATSVRVRDGRTAITDGPFVETTEHLGGYYIVDVSNLDRAIELAAQIPAARDGVVEVRPIVAM